MRLPLPHLEFKSADPTSVRWIRTLWDRMSPLPGGSQLFSRLLGRRIPYTGSIHPQVLQLGPGFAIIQMKDHRSLRNHLDSVHAIALTNLAELTGNAALAYSLPEDARFIVTEFTMRYLKKARGTITARCQCTPVTSNERKAYPLEVQLFDPGNELVATATLHSLVGPLKKAAR